VPAARVKVRQRQWSQSNRTIFLSERRRRSLRSRHNRRGDGSITHWLSSTEDGSGGDKVDEVSTMLLVRPSSERRIAFILKSQLQQVSLGHRGQVVPADEVEVLRHGGPGNRTIFLPKGE
jgi:hypothetical protein